MLEFRVPDIHCDGCIRALTGAVRDLDEHATLQVDMETKQVLVTTIAARQAVADVMSEAGFTVEPG